MNADQAFRASATPSAAILLALACSLSAATVAAAQCDSVETLPETMRAIRMHAYGANMDAVIDTVGGETLERSLGVLRPGGRLFSIAGSVNNAACTEAGILCPKEASAPQAQRLAELKTLIDNDQLRINVQSVLPLKQAAQAQERNRAGHTRGKIVVRIAE